MNILFKLVIKSFLNPFSLFLYDNTYIFILVIITCSLFIFILSILFFFYKINKIILFISFVLICFTAFIFIYSHNRGRELNEIRNNGFLLLKYIEELRLHNNRYPYNIEEIYNYISDNNNEDFVNVLKTKNVYYFYNINTNDTNLQKFNLTIYKDMLGFEYFAYRINPIRFELTDD